VFEFSLFRPSMSLGLKFLHQHAATLHDIAAAEVIKPRPPSGCPVSRASPYTGDDVYGCYSSYLKLPSQVIHNVETQISRKRYISCLYLHFTIIKKLNVYLTVIEKEHRGIDKW
jgi:hypothetical protein